MHKLDNITVEPSCLILKAVTYGPKIFGYIIEVAVVIFYKQYPKNGVHPDAYAARLATFQIGHSIWLTD